MAPRVDLLRKKERKPKLGAVVRAMGCERVARVGLVRYREPVTSRPRGLPRSLADERVARMPIERRSWRLAAHGARLQSLCRRAGRADTYRAPQAGGFAAHGAGCSRFFEATV